MDEDTVVVIPASHVYDEIVVKVIATVFNDGLREGTCTRCGTELSEVLPQTEANILKFSTGDSTYKSSIPFASLIEDGGHFYPTEDNPEGNDLFVEYSILLNDTTDKLKGGTWAISGIRDDSSANGNAAYWLYFKPNASWCPFKGGFEADLSAGAELLFGPPCNDVTNLDGYVVIENYNGWHRIGVQVHQETTIEDGFPVYYFTATLFIDGVKASSHSLNLNETNYLYYAIVEDGEIVGYADNDMNDRCIYAYRLDDFKTNIAGEIAYLVIADVHISCGNGFVLPVTPVTDPEDQDFITNGETLDGRAFFSYGE